jgi:hypothetical protein
VERLFVALQPKILQPSRDIHDVLLPKYRRSIAG